MTMAVAARRDARMRVAAYREWAAARPDEERWELIGGEPVPMAPPSERHQVIAFNLTRALATLAEQKGCRAVQGLGILDDGLDDHAPIPDVVVRCGPLSPDGYASDPLLVAEILSPSTAKNDRIVKAGFSLTIPTLRLFLLVAQDEPRVEVWRRAGDDGRHAVVRPGDHLAIPERDGARDVAAVYASLPPDPA